MNVQDYCASKFAAVGLHESMTHGLLTDEKYDGVKTTLVCPYLVDNDMFEGCKIRYALFSAHEVVAGDQGRVQLMHRFATVY